MSAARGDRKAHFLESFEREHERTMRVLGAFPEGHDDFRPHPTSRPARDVAFPLAMGQSVMVRALTTGLDFSKPQAPPSPPATVREIAELVERERGRVVDALRDYDDGRLDETVQFYTGPKTIGDYRKIDFLWFFLLDHVHHRGQLSTYLRPAGAKVPAIYGPSGDEPWR